MSRHMGRPFRLLGTSFQSRGSMAKAFLTSSGGGVCAPRYRREGTGFRGGGPGAGAARLRRHC